MRLRHSVVLALLACGGPPIEEPIELADFHTIATGYPHDWTQYTCTVRAALTAELDGATRLDSISVGAGVADTITLTLPVGRYRARFETRWRGRPGTSWDIESEWFVEETTVTAPGTHEIRCP